MTKLLLSLALGVTYLAQSSYSIQIDLNSRDSVKSASREIAKNLMSSYVGDKPGQTPGVLPRPYYWWQAGALWGEMIEYWSYTGDSQWNDVVTQALLFQTGKDKNYMPENVTKEEGNDDQAFWAFAVMSAAELKFPDPPSKKASWLALAQAVFNSQVQRWDTRYCAGGLRWQIFFANPGWEYKNTISNGAFFQLAARLARYTGNSTYAAWAEKTWDWLASTPNLTPDFQVNDGSNVNKNCTDTNHDQWSYNYGTLIMGAAYMYSITRGAAQDKWKTRLSGLLETLFTRFFPREISGNKASENVLVEIWCEPPKNCNPDQTSFKAYTARWLAVTTQLAPFTAGLIMPKLRDSAKGAAAQCSGGDSGNWCGQNWNSDQWDGFNGVGEQMSALSVIGASMIEKSPKPVTASSGGTSEGDPNAGYGDTSLQFSKVTKSEKVGAGILTFFMILSILGTAWFMVEE